jgi:hypothetical protein
MLLVKQMGIGVYRLFLALSVITLSTGKLFALTAHPYPNIGMVYYDGDLHASAPFHWTTAPLRHYLDPAFELDIATGSGVFASCTTWTDLPSGYDDCETAGVSEPDGSESFGAGTYHLKDIIPNHFYNVEWDFVNQSFYYGLSPSVTWQELERTLCSFEDPWCYFGGNGGVLMVMSWSYGTPTSQGWSYP